jgi:hypothetical protein
MNRTAAWLDRIESKMPVDRGGQPHAIGEVLAELLARYQVRFPEINVTVIDLPAESFAVGQAVG